MTMSVWSRLRGWAGGGGLDSRRVQQVRTRYEIESGYADYQRFCRSRFARALPPAAAPIVEKGRELLRVLEPAAAHELRRDVEERFRCHPTRDKADHLQYFAVDDQPWGRALLERIVTREVDEQAARFFGSEFFVYWFTITRATPVQELGRNSFRWHCDRGPVAHLKLLLYLNGEDEHGGGTEFLDLATTRALEPSGYVFAPVRTRVIDLGPLAVRAGVTIEPWAPELRAGEGVLFQPSSVLHRGRLPTRGSRHVVTVCLLPSPIPWRTAYDSAGVVPAHGYDKWHAKAAELREALTRVAAEGA